MTEAERIKFCANSSFQAIVMSEISEMLKKMADIKLVRVGNVEYARYAYYFHDDSKLVVREYADGTNEINFK